MFIPNLQIKKLRPRQPKRLSEGPKLISKGVATQISCSLRQVFFALSHRSSLSTLLLDLDKWSEGNWFTCIRRICVAFSVQQRAEGQVSLKHRLAWV